MTPLPENSKPAMSPTKNHPLPIGASQEAVRRKSIFSADDQQGVAFLKAQVKNSPRPALAKSAVFEAIFPHPLRSNEWQVIWPIVHRNGVTYNPDYWCEELQVFIELATSINNIHTERDKWQQAMNLGYPLRVFWWEGDEITNSLESAPRLLRHRQQMASFLERQTA